MSQPEKAEKFQRIKLRCVGSPVKWDATILTSDPRGKRIKVRFDGPLDDLILVAYGDKKMVSNGTDKDGKYTETPREMNHFDEWEVL